MKSLSFPSPCHPSLLALVYGFRSRAQVERGRQVINAPFLCVSLVRCKAPLTLAGPGHLYGQRDDDEILGLVCLLALFELPDEVKGAVVSTSSLPLKCHSPGNSLVFRWSRLRLSLLWTWVQSLVGEVKIPQAMQPEEKKKKTYPKSLWSNLITSQC